MAKSYNTTLLHPEILGIILGKILENWKRDFFREFLEIGKFEDFQMNEAISSNFGKASCFGKFLTKSNMPNDAHGRHERWLAFGFKQGCNCLQKTKAVEF